MTKTNSAESAQIAEKNVQTKKKRGIGNATGVQRLTFDNRDAQPNGLFLGHIESIEVKEVDFSSEKTGIPSFAGCKVPVLNVNFASNEADASRRKYARLRLMAVESNSLTIDGGKEAWKVEAVFNWLKHLLDVFYLKGRELTDSEADMLSLTYDDTDDDGNYVNVAPETVLAGWKAVFDNFASIMNTANNDSPVFTNNGKAVIIWMKLVRYTKNGNKGWQEVNRGALAFPTFVGQGCIELYKQNVIPVIKLDVTRERIIPMEIKKDTPKTPNINMPSMPVIGGGVNIDMGSEMSVGIDTNFNTGMGFDDDLPEL